MEDEGHDTSAAQHFARLTETYCQRPNVSTGSGFGAGLRVHGKVFGLLSREGAFVLKLPRTRVDELVAAGCGTRFDPRRDGRQMREWVVLPPEQAALWNACVAEAYAFVSAGV